MIPVPVECHILTLNVIALLLSDAIAHNSMAQLPDHFQIPLTSAHFVADKATHALVSTATVKATFRDERKTLKSVIDGIQKREN